MDPNVPSPYRPHTKDRAERLGLDEIRAPAAGRQDATTIAALAERFYDLFPESTPRGPSDLAYFAALVDDFGALVDIVEQMKRYAAWTLDHGTGVAKSPRNGLRGWIERTQNSRPYRY